MAETVVNVSDAPGWLRHSEPSGEGKSRRIWYTDPSGTVVSKTAFAARKKAGTLAYFPAHDRATYDLPEIVDATAEEWAPAPLPEPEPRPLATGRDRPHDNRATSQEISTSCLYIIVLVSGILAFLLRADELQMSEEEGADLALPLGNILSSSRLNRRYGRYLRDAGDYTQLGYALGSYGLRVATMMRERNERTPHARTAQSVPPAQQPAGVAAPGYPAGGTGSGPVPLPSQGQAASWYSPIPGTRPASTQVPPGSSNGTVTGHDAAVQR